MATAMNQKDTPRIDGEFWVVDGHRFPRARGADETDVAELRTVEEINSRLHDIQNRMEEIDREYAGQALPDEARSEFEGLQEEKHDRIRARDEMVERQRWIGEMADQPGHTERGAEFQTARPGATRGDDIWDLTTIRASVTNPEAMLDELHDRCKRAIEVAIFPDDRVNSDNARAHIERLLQRDDPTGELGRRILITGRPSYQRTFRKYLSGHPLSPDEQRAAFSLTTTGFPVPYVLDPTMLPVSSSVVNPLRAISSVEQIVGANEWRGLTAGAVTASRVSEVTEAVDNTPTLAQPTIPTSKAQCFIPFSIEAGQDWSGMDTAVARLIADSKDDEEATAFATGNGTPPNPSGVVTGATGTTPASTGLTITAANLYSLEGALAPRFRPRAQIVANRAMYNIIRALDTAGGAQLWLRIGESIPNNPAPEGGQGNTGLKLLGYPVNELSTMQATVVNATKIMLIGDFSYFKIIDRVGLTIELIPHIFGATARYPIGQRGFYAYWRNGSKVIDPVAFRALTGTT